MERLYAIETDPAVHRRLVGWQRAAPLAHGFANVTGPGCRALDPTMARGPPDNSYPACSLVERIHFRALKRRDVVALVLSGSSTPSFLRLLGERLDVTGEDRAVDVEAPLLNSMAE